MENNTNNIVIQIINYKTKKYLKKCLETLFNDLKNAKFSYHINVLDNASDDDLSELEYLYKNEKISFYYSDKNLGFGNGNNFLSKKIVADYLLFINPDIRLIEKNTIGRLYEKIQKNEKVKVIGPQLITINNKVQKWDHGDYKGLKAWVMNNIGSSFYTERNTDSEVAWISGAFFLIENKVFKKIGKFDKNFFLYKEEEDLCLRIREANMKILYHPNVKVLHHGSVVASKNDFMKASIDYYIKKNFEGTFKYKLALYIKENFMKNTKNYDTLKLL